MKASVIHSTYFIFFLPNLGQNDWGRSKSFWKNSNSVRKSCSDSSTLQVFPARSFWRLDNEFNQLHPSYQFSLPPPRKVLLNIPQIRAPHALSCVRIVFELNGRLWPVVFGSGAMWADDPHAAFLPLAWTYHRLLWKQNTTNARKCNRSKILWFRSSFEEKKTEKDRKKRLKKNTYSLTAIRKLYLFQKLFLLRAEGMAPDIGYKS